MFEALGVLASKLIVPVVNWISGKLGRQVPKWAAHLRDFGRRMWLQARVSDDEVAILRCIVGRQQDYAHVEWALAGQLEGDALLLAVTSLQALGLLSEPRLSQPPDPGALFTITGDAELMLRSRKKPTRPKARRRDVPEAASRRKRVADNRDWFVQHESSLRAGYIPAALTDEAASRTTEIAADQEWLQAHGF